MRLSAGITAQSHDEIGEAFHEIRNAGYEGIEFSWPGVQPAPGTSNPAPVLRELLEKNQLIASNVELSPLGITDESGLCEIVGLWREQMMQVRQIPCDLVSIKAGPRRQQSLDLCVLALNAILPTVDELGLSLALANGYGTRIEQLEDWRHILLEVEHPRFRALIDCGQFHDAAVNPRDALRELGDLAGFVRIGDRVGRRPLPLGEGEINVRGIIEHLQNINFAGWLSVENACLPGNLQHFGLQGTI